MRSQVAKLGWQQVAKTLRSIRQAFEKLGGCSRTRTCDPLIKSQLLQN
jgi:hypothetical protein